MKLPTLYEFIESHNNKPYHFPNNSFVHHNDFEDFYVRWAKRYIGDKREDKVLDIARIAAKVPGRGDFVKLIKEIKERYNDLTIYVECVLNPRFERKLIRLGFKQVNELNSYYLLPEMDINNE